LKLGWLYCVEMSVASCPKRSAVSQRKETLGSMFHFTVRITVHRNEWSNAETNHERGPAICRWGSC